MRQDYFELPKERTAADLFMSAVIDGLSQARRRVSWQPLPGPQTMAFECKADEIYYGGAPGGGKTDLAIGAAILNHHRSVIFRRESTQLNDIIDRSKEILGTNSGNYNESKRRWYLNNGKMIEFGSCELEKDWQKWQGRPHDFKVFDEATHFGEKMFLVLSGWNRASRPGQVCQILLTGNPPINNEGRWIALRYAAWLDPKHPNPAKPGELRWFIRVNDVDTEVDGPGCYRAHKDGGIDAITEDEYNTARKAKEKGISRAKSRTFIPASLEDNPYLGSDYEATIDALPEPMRTIYKTGNHFYGLDDAEWQVIPTAWVLAAIERWKEWRAACGGKIMPPLVRIRDAEGNETRVPAKRSAIGADCARGGRDKNVFAPRHNQWFAPLIVIAGAETPTGTILADKLLPYIVDECAVNMDLLNIGSSPFDRLNDLGVPNVYPINFGAGSDAVDKSGRLKMLNLRSEAYWRFRELLDPESGEDVMLPDDPELVADLTAPTFKYTVSGLQVEAKPDIKKRLGRSPDKADAVVMAALVCFRPSWDF